MSSGFVTETEIAEAKKKRQEEWDKVRKPDDPLERPEEPYDPRSLYDRLKEQKDKKDLEYEEAHKLKNMIKGLDDDEIEFLDLVDRTKLAADRKKELEEELELNDYRNRVATLQEKSMDERLQAEKVANKPKTNTNRMSQQKLLKGLVQVKKNEPKKRKLSDENNDSNEEAKTKKVTDEPNVNGEVVVVTPGSSLKCVGILPGLGHYSQSSDEESSDADLEPSSVAKVDILGRKILTKVKES